VSVWGTEPPVHPQIDHSFLLSTGARTACSMKESKRERADPEEGAEGLLSAGHPAMDLSGDTPDLAENGPRGAVLEQLLLLPLNVNLDEVDCAALCHRLHV
jgi:hypothetical protein